MKHMTALALVFAVPGALSAQTTARGLVVPVPPEAAVIATIDSFTTPAGERRELQVIRPRTAAVAAVPMVIFANNNGPGLMRARSYQEWARLVTTRQLAGVLYEGGGLDQTLSPEASARVAAAFRLRARGGARNAAVRGLIPVLMLLMFPILDCPGL